MSLVGERAHTRALTQAKKRTFFLQSEEIKIEGKRHFLPSKQELS
jgi:hypothetical protein